MTSSTDSPLFNGGKWPRHQQNGTHELWVYDQDVPQSGCDSLTSIMVMHEPGETKRSSPVLITMVGDEYDHTLGLMGRKPFDHVIYSTPMADHLVIGLHIENQFMQSFICPMKSFMKCFQYGDL